MNIDQPLVSVIIPAYNAEKFIGSTLNSVFTQTYKNIEIIVVDDGSQDKTVEIVKGYCDRGTSITLLQQENSGVAAARNLAIAHANGELIAPLDADDIWYPHNLEKQVHKMMQQDESVGLVYAWSVFINEDGDLLNYALTYNFEGDVHVPLAYYNFLGNASSALIRRSCFEQIGGYDLDYQAANAQGCEDWDLYVRLAKSYQFVVVPELLIGYRQTIGSMSFAQNAMDQSHNIFLSKIAQVFPELPDIIFDWNKSNFYSYQAGKSFGCGAYLNTIRYSFMAMKLDYFPLLRPKFHLLNLVSIAKLMANPFARWIWPNHLQWKQFVKLFKSYISNKKLTLSEVYDTKIKQSHRWPTRQQNKFLLSRFDQIKQSL